MLGHGSDWWNSALFIMLCIAALVAVFVAFATSQLFGPRRTRRRKRQTCLLATSCRPSAGLQKRRQRRPKLRSLNSRNSTKRSRPV